MSFNKLILIIIALITFMSNTDVYGQEVTFEETDFFYSDWDPLRVAQINSGYLTVPENWQDSNSKKIKIATIVLQNNSNIENAEATVFIQGGPGAEGIQNFMQWFYHPLRKTNDIVILDIRGTGFSEPRLCPDLGKELLKILAKDQSVEQDEAQKTAAALACKQDLLVREVDTKAYNSLSISKDLNALKEQLGYTAWNVYGVSYGTYIAQVYANAFPKDIKTLILDSSVADISDYYTQNTGNYMSSLSKVFDKCKNDPDCNAQYPNLEKVFFNTIQDLNETPLTVSVGKHLTGSKEFTYNAEDFKVAIQQALYHKKLVEILPLLIYQFNNRNSEALGNLVESFSSLLNMDYGVYYCVSCNEVLPNNDFSDYDSISSTYDQLEGGISFYQSDFKVCEKWNIAVNDSFLLHHDLSGLAKLSAPVMIFAGEFDPITPAENGVGVAKNFSNSYLLDAHTYGHVPGFTRIGKQLTDEFVNTPNQAPDLNAFKNAPPISFANGVKLNGGISSMGVSLSQLNPLFVIPLLIALVLMLVYVFVHLIKLIRGRYKLLPDKLVRMLSVLTSVTGVFVLTGFILALSDVSNYNYFILAFGLPDEYNYLFIGLFVFVALLLLTVVCFFTQIKKINERSIVFSVIFSHIVFTIYFVYWGVI